MRLILVLTTVVLFAGPLRAQEADVARALDLERMAEAALAAGRPEEAKSRIEERLRLGPSATAEILLARALAVTGDDDAALDALERAVEAGYTGFMWDDPFRYFEIIRRWRPLGRYDELLRRRTENRRRYLIADARRLAERRAELDRVEQLLLDSRVLWQDGHCGIVNSVDWSADSRRLLSTCEQDDTVRLWNAFTGEAIAVLGRHDEPDARFDATGERILVHDGPTERASLWDGRTGQFLGWLPDPEALVIGVRFARNADRVLTRERNGRITSHDLDGLPVGSVDVGEPVLAFDTMANGEQLLVATLGGSLQRFSLDSGKRLPIATPPRPVSRVVAGPRGKFTLSRSHAGQLYLHDLREPGRPPAALGFDHASTGVFSPDGEHVIAISEPTKVEVWSTAEATRTHVFELDGFVALRNVSLSPKGDRLAILTGQPDTWEFRGTVLDLLTGAKLCSFGGGRELNAPRGIAFMPDGRRVVTAEGDGYSIAMWDAETGKWLGQGIDTIGSVLDLEPSPSGNRVAYASYSRFAGVYRFDQELNRPLLCTGTGHSLTLCLDRDSGLVTVGGSLWPPPYRQTSWQFDPRTGATTLGPVEGHARSVTRDGSGDLLFNQGDDTDGFQRISGTTGETLWSLDRDSTFFDMVPSADGSRLLAHTMDLGAPNLVLLDARTGEQVRAFEEFWHGGRLISANVAAISADARQVAFCSDRSGGIGWWDADSDVVARIEGHGENVRRLAFSRDGAHLVTVSADRTARIWDSSTRQVVHVLEGHENVVWDLRLAFDDSELFTCATDGTVRRWDMESGELLATYICGAGESVWTLAIHEQTGLLAAAGSSGVVRLFDFDVPTEDPELLEGHSGAIRQLAFDAQGDRLYSVADDLTLRVFDVDEAELLLTHVQYRENDFIRFTPEGYYVGTEGAADTARIVVESRLERGVWPLSSYAAILNDPEKVAAKLRGERVRVPVLPQGPAVDVLSPTTGDVTSRNLRLELTAADRTGIEKITVLQDGSPLSDARLAAALFANPSNTQASLSFELEISEGRTDTEIVVRAENRRGIRSVPQRIRVVYQPPANDLYLLAMGVADYEDDTLDLAYPVKDADDLIARFESEAGGIYREVHVRRLADDEVTGSNLRRARETFLHQAKAADTIIVFAAGHGVRSDTGEYYYLTPGATAADPYDGIERTQLESLVTWDRLLAKRRLLLIDTCHSGEAYGEATRGSMMTAAFEQDEVDLAIGEGLYIFAASSEAGLARERDGNGLFTRALIDGLDGAADDGGDGNGLVDVVELMSYASKRVMDDSDNRQRPTTPRVEGGDPFGLARKRGP